MTPDALVVQAVLALPSRLRAHRLSNRLRSGDVASAIGIDRKTLSRIEKGEGYTVDALVLVAAYLDRETES